MTGPTVTLELPLSEVVLLASAAAALADTRAELYAEACRVVGQATADELFFEEAGMRALADRLLALVAEHDAGR